tara:strand:+ start:219 stop:1724 length:1506 start_codon:yes stop_codon:yes gene_type:complete
MLKSNHPSNVLALSTQSPASIDLPSLLENASHHPIPLPTQHNTLAFLAEQAKNRTALVHFANQAKPVIDIKLLKLMQDFLTYKKRHGSQIEKDLYKNILLDEFISRLLIKRPFVFMGESDYYQLQDGQTGMGHFDSIGQPQEEAPFILKDYLSYDEMQIAALITVATPSFFVNKGHKTNKGIPGEPDSFEKQGLIVGTVGTRFERPNLNEYAHILITREQNTFENGYGKHANKQQKEKHRYFAQYYHQGEFDDYYFPSYEEAEADTENKYIALNNDVYINAAVYKRRIRAVIEPFLVSANEFGQKNDRHVFVEASRIGLGVWAIDATKQAPLQLEVYAEILSEVPLPAITDINFGRFKNNSEVIWQGLLKAYSFEVCGNNINIHHIERSPLEKLPLPHHDKVLVTNYAWDGNAFPGNEYWLGKRYFAASSDPAAACCTQICELQNPLINPNICGANTTVTLQGRMIPIQWFDRLKCHGQYPIFISETNRMIQSSQLKPDKK